MSSLNSKNVADVLDRLFAEAEVEDPPRFERLKTEFPHDGQPRDEAGAYRILAEVFMPVDRAGGRLLYCLARAQGSRLIVEFGTSFGISTIHLAAAARDNDGGRVVTTEMEPGKVKRAREHLQEAGLLDQVEIREGDALETLRTLDGTIDLLFLDGWKKLYLPVLRLLEPRLRQGAAVIADDINLFPEELEPYLGYIRSPANGYVSEAIPLGDGLELSVNSRPTCRQH
jgi:predicted O-methyltransferase YrrM